MLIATMMLVLYLLVLLVLIGRVTELFTRNLDLKFKNEQLVDDLTTHNDELQLLLGKLHQSEQLSSGAFDGAGVGMLLVDKNMIIFRVNNEATLLLGYERDNLLDTSFANLLSEEEQTQGRSMFSDLVDGKQERGHVKRHYIRIEGTDIWVQETISAVTHKGEFQFAIVHLQDMTQEYRLTKKLSYQANHDTLTGLMSRYAFETKMTNLFAWQDNQ